MCINFILIAYSYKLYVTVYMVLRGEIRNNIYCSILYMFRILLFKVL